MAFDRIFQGPPIAEVASNGPETAAFGVDVVNQQLYVSAGSGTALSYNVKARVSYLG